MKEPAALSTQLSPARNRAAVMHELRRLLPARQQLGKVCWSRVGPRRFGQNPAFRSRRARRPPAGGGLPCGALHEIVPATEGALPAAFGFIVALLARLVRTHPFIFVLPAYERRRHGRLSGHGLNSLGLDPSRAILVEPAHRNETLWAMAEAVALGGAASGRRFDRPARSEDQPEAASRRQRRRAAAFVAAAGPDAGSKRRRHALADRHRGSRPRPLRRPRASPLASATGALPQRTAGRMGSGVRSCRASFQFGYRAGRSGVFSRRRRSRRRPKSLARHLARRSILTGRSSLSLPHPAAHASPP